MKIVKPMSLGLLHKPYCHCGRRRLCVAALGFFRLGADDTRFLTENLQWPLVLSSLPEDQALDEVMPKANGEVLLCGQAHAPGGTPVGEMGVRLACAGMEKNLRVVGDRQWLYGLIPWYRVTKPQLFASMSLSYARAFGGPRHPGNLVGRGHTGNLLAGLVGVNQGFLPNLEYPDKPVKQHWRRQPPAAFGPLDLRCTPRQGRGGTYDAAWLQSDFPGLPTDIDWRIFNRAAEDQWLAGYFAGGEAYRLDGMHPQHAVVAGRLPNFRARAFVLRKDAAPPQAEEVPLRWDTVWFFPEHLLGVAVWHGDADIADSDAEDVAALMVAYEHPDHSRDLAHYRHVLSLRLDPATAVAHAMNESQLAPPRTLAEAARIAAARQDDAAKRAAEQAALLQDMHEDLTQEFGDQGMAPPAAPAMPPSPLLPPTQEELASGDFDLSDYLEQARKLAEDAKREGEAKQKELAERQAELATLLPPVPAENAEERWQETLAKASQPAWDLTGGRPEDDERYRDLAETLKQPPPASPEEAAEREQARAAIAGTRANERRARCAAPTPTPDSLPAELAARLGRQALAWHRAGVCLAGRDLAGADLNGADLKCADLREIMLENADLSGADLTGADLTGAALTGANLDGARLAGAKLEGANLSGSRGQATNLSGANLARAQISAIAWRNADLSGACLDGLIGTAPDLGGAMLDGSHGRGVLLAQAKLADSRWRNTEFAKLTFLETDLVGADFSNARLDTCVFLDAKLTASRWHMARLTGIYGGGKTDWREADFTGAQGQRCGFGGAGFAAARFVDADFRRCDFGGCKLPGADLSGALLSGSLFYGADLTDCRAPGSDWFQALCRKTDFRGADLSGANFVQAELTEARFEKARLKNLRLDEKRRAA